MKEKALVMNLIKDTVFGCRVTKNLYSSSYKAIVRSNLKEKTIFRMMYIMKTAMVTRATKDVEKNSERMS